MFSGECGDQAGCAWDTTTGNGMCMMNTRRRLTKAEKQDIRRRLETKTKTPKYTDKDFPGTYLDYPLNEMWSYYPKSAKIERLNAGKLRQATVDYSQCPNPNNVTKKP